MSVDVHGNKYLEDGGYWSWNGHSGVAQYTLVITFGAPSVLPESNWNCTGRGNWFVAGDFTGLVVGNTVCDAASCCSEYMNNPKFGTSQGDWHVFLDNLVSGGACPAADLPESLYCLMVSGHAYPNCLDCILSPGTRLYQVPCIDVALNYWLQCSIMRVSVFEGGMIHEPPHYYDMLTSEQNIALGMQFLSPDHICFPYSYYHPDVVASPDASTTAEASAPAASDPASGDSSTGILYSFAAFLCCVFVF
jgi:hypothetical protein